MAIAILVGFTRLFARQNDEANRAAQANNPPASTALNFHTYYISKLNDVPYGACRMSIALGIRKVVKIGSTVLNLFAEPQYSKLHKGMQPQFKVFTGINLQLMGNLKSNPH